MGLNAPIKVGTATRFEVQGYGRIVLTASDSTQYAWEGEQVAGQAENSLFTHFLAEGLRTGKADRNCDGKIEADEWYDYAYRQVLQVTPKQKPLYESRDFYANCTDFHIRTLYTRSSNFHL